MVLQPVVAFVPGSNLLVMPMHAAPNPSNFHPPTDLFFFLDSFALWPATSLRFPTHCIHYTYTQCCFVSVTLEWSLARRTNRGRKVRQARWFAATFQKRLRRRWTDRSAVSLDIQMSVLAIEFWNSSSACLLTRCRYTAVGPVASNRPFLMHRERIFWIK